MQKHTRVFWLKCWHRYSNLRNSTYMKVILTKNLPIITIIYNTKFQFAKISRTMKKCNCLNFCDLYVLRNGETSQVSFVLKWNGALEGYQMVSTYIISWPACLSKVWTIKSFFIEMKEIKFIHCAPKLMEILQPTFLRKLMDVYIGEHAAMT